MIERYQSSILLISLTELLTSCKSVINIANSLDPDEAPSNSVSYREPSLSNTNYNIGYAAFMFTVAERLVLPTNALNTDH